MAQIKRPQNAIMAIHIRPACHQAQPPPYQNIITTISLREPGLAGLRPHIQGRLSYPWGVVPSVPPRGDRGPGLISADPVALAGSGDLLDSLVEDPPAALVFMGEHRA